MKQTVHRAELTTMVIVPKGPNVENGTSQTADSTRQANVEQETSAYSTIAIRMGKSSMVVLPTVPPKQKLKHVRRLQPELKVPRVQL